MMMMIAMSGDTTSCGLLYTYVYVNVERTNETRAEIKNKGGKEDDDDGRRRRRKKEELVTWWK
jgi:hypothetical protein